MSNFQHDIAGGQGNLIATAVQSPNFVAGSSGWQVRKDGSVEFNNGTFRGTVTAATIIGALIESAASGRRTTMDSNGDIKAYNASGAVLFWYDNSDNAMFQYADTGSSTQGALVSSVTAATGTDPFGNAYLAGFTNYGTSGGTNTSTNLDSGQLNAYTASSPGGPWTLQGSLAFDPTSGWLTISQAPLNCENHLFVSGGSFVVTNSTPASFTGNVTISGTLTVGGSTDTSTDGLTDGTINGLSSNAGLTNGTINGTSGGASAGTAHTHGGGSYAVTNGQHNHGPGGYAVTNGQHAHSL